MRTRLTFTVALIVTAAIFWLLGLHSRAVHVEVQQPLLAAPKTIPAQPSATDAVSADAPTNLYAHNFLLQQGPDLEIYFAWMRGQMIRTNPEQVPSFDDAKSFLINIQKGVIRVPLKDIAKVLNSREAAKAPLTHVSLSFKGDELLMHGIVHKLIPLPVELTCTVSGTPDSKLILHVNHFTVMKLPLKGLLGDFHIKLDDLVQSKTPGITIRGNDVILDAHALLPSPHIVGEITSVQLSNSPQGPVLEAIFGGAGNDPVREQRWHNFLQLTDGTLNFGKLTMHHVDLIMIDASKEPWFHLDLNNYQAQLVGGITHMTPQAGLQIFMPSLKNEPRMIRAQQTITMQWLKDRDLPPPPDIPQN
jgi:hypothetical protein